MGRVNILKQFTDTQRKRINCVRMYLGVNWISELATIDGRYIIKNIGEPTCKLHYCVTLMKPFAKRPNARSWALFEMVIDSFTTDKFGTLETELGNWTLDHSACGRWNAYKDENNLVYEHVYHPLEEEER